MARAAGAVRSPRTARHDAAALAGRHVRLAEPGRHAARHARLGIVRRGSVGTSRPPRARPRRLRALEAQRRRARAAERAQPAAGAGQGPAATGRRPSWDVRLLRLRRGRPDAGAPGLLGHHRARGAAAAVGARLHAVAPDARGRRADARHRRDLPSQADPAGCPDLPGHRLHAARVEHEAAVVPVQPGSVEARRDGGHRRPARAKREGRRPHGAVGPRPARDAQRDDSAAARRGARRVAHRELLAAARAAGEDGHRRFLARRRRLVQPPRAHQAPPALLPGPPPDDTQRPSVEPSAQRLPRDCSMGWLGLVGRHRQRVEDARGADRGRHQLLPQHRSLLGVRHRRLLSKRRADGRALRPLVPVRRVLRLVPLARPHLVDTASLGVGTRRDGAARVRQHQHTDPARRPTQHPGVGAEQPGDRADSQEICGTPLPAPAIHVQPGVGSP